MLRYCTVLGLAITCVAAARAQEDDTLDWVMEHAATSPTTQPAPATGPYPLSSPRRVEDRTGTVTFSDGSSVAGQVSTTPGKPLRIWVEAEHQYVDVPLSEVSRIEAAVLWERMEKEWHFAASGSDVKEYTGRTYPARELQFTFALRDGRKVTGSTVAPLYVQVQGEQQTVVLPKRQKGAMGTSLDLLRYPKVVELNGRSTP